MNKYIVYIFFITLFCVTSCKIKYSNDISIDRNISTYCTNMMITYINDSNIVNNIYAEQLRLKQIGKPYKIIVKAHTKNHRINKVEVIDYTKVIPIRAIWMFKKNLSGKICNQSDDIRGLSEEYQNGYIFFIFNKK